MKLFTLVVRHYQRLRQQSRARRQLRRELAALERMPRWLQRDMGVRSDGAKLMNVPRDTAPAARPWLHVIECNPQAVKRGHRHKVVHRRRFAVFRRDVKRIAGGEDCPVDQGSPPAAD